MSFRYVVVITLIACSLPCIYTFAIDSSEPLDGDNFRDARQISAITNPFRRVANSTRNVVKYIRDYSMARYQNTTTPAPQTSVGKRVVPLLQHVTLNNIRDAVNTLLSSPAAPAVVGIIKNLDRDTLQLFNSHDRTLPPLGILPTTTPKPVSNTTSGNSTANNSTISGASANDGGGSNSTTTVVSLVESSTSAARSIISSNSANDRLDKVKQTIAQENEDDEDDSTEDDD